MRATFIVRLLDAAGELIAWTRVEAEARPQREAASCPFFALEPSRFVAERAGRACQISVHWPDLDVARVNKEIVEPTDVEAGQVLAFAWFEPVWLVAGSRGVPLTPEAERQAVVLGVPVGTLKAAGT
mgnify:CR=1 FL=1